MGVKQERKDDVTRNLSHELMWVGIHADDLPGRVVLLEIRLKISDTETADHMAVVKAVIDAVPAVAFVTAPDLDTLAHLVAAKLMNGSMKWREDRPYGT